ncbi:putative RNA polymerase II subunit B1 CTD phosphatase RPAP2 [Fopius arisanus]|uniref:RNA polymerase II subunit B1 CTD phosphatase RPAP2 homolog n=1 Tax=Fopius arisanus TaxID=64838 RepID=A0A9R1TTG3_9HYME|nr:PREDICTED: putative RNA polymerase II subunit B1 CTD phosphatase RPAP2 [Fopius arisanus]XP_011315098.1 PREDICTED: putative RNA polymerase II subunit B1 CTD phosphatase RPAP2 [Fopius arisanus]
MTIMSDAAAKAKLRSARIKAAKAAKKLPTAILLQRKVECDAKALKIVERLIETQVEEEWLLQNLGQINRSHLEDVIEERAILKLCGYPLCDNPLTKIVNKQYKISTLRNKVYDVQQTKNFCSFWCYSATEYLLEQMLTSPLWLRAEEEIPSFILFDKPKATVKNPPGVEVNIVGLDLPPDRDCPSGREEKIPKISDERNSEISEEVRNEETCDEITERSSEDSNKLLEKNRPPFEFSNQSSGITGHQSNILKTETTASKSELELKNSLTNSEITDSLIDSEKKNLEKSLEAEKSLPERPKKSEFTKNADKIKKLKKRPSVSFASITSRVEQSITEWITKHTIDLLHGDESTKQKLLETLTQQDRYGELCKKLNTLQLEESKEDRVSAIQSSFLQPAPHFSVLKEEAETLEVKVRAFYHGSTVIEPPPPKETTDEEEEEPKVVPLTSAHAPIALRRRIFLDKLNKVLPDLLRALSGPGQYQHAYTPDKLAKVKALVSTFKLSATNIVFKTAEWTLVAFLIIKILSIMDVSVKNLLSSKQATMYTSMILMSYQLDSHYLDRLVASLTLKDSTDNDKENGHLSDF